MERSVSAHPKRGSPRKKNASRESTLFGGKFYFSLLDNSILSDQYFYMTKVLTNILSSGFLCASEWTFSPRWFMVGAANAVVTMTFPIFSLFYCSGRIII
jgi:hypothetical protein